MEEEEEDSTCGTRVTPLSGGEARCASFNVLTASSQKERERQRERELDV